MKLSKRIRVKPKRTLEIKCPNCKSVLSRRLIVGQKQEVKCKCRSLLEVSIPAFIKPGGVIKGPLVRANL